MSVGEAPARIRVRAFPRVRGDVLVLLGIGAAAAALRLWDLGDQSYWYDEAITVDLVHGSFGHMLAGTHAHEATPPLYFALAWGWAHIFGASETALRSLSAVFGVLTVPVAYLVGREVGGRRAAVITAAFAAFSPALIWYSQEARSYALMVLLCALSLLFFVRALRETTMRPYVLWGVAVALALLTHYFSLFISVPQALFLLARAPNRRAALAAIGGVVLVGVALTPLALYQRVHGGAAWIQHTGLRGRVKDAAAFFAVGYSRTWPVVVALLALVLAGAIVVVLRRSDAGPRRALIGIGALAVATLAIPLVGALAGNDYFLDRNVLAAWLPAAAVVAAALASQRLGYAGAALAVAVCVLFLVADYRTGSNEALQRDNWRGMSATLGPPAPDRVITLAPAWQIRTLSLYRPIALMTTPLRLREVDEVVYGGPDPWHRHQVVFPPGHGFRAVKQWKVQRFTVVRYLAPRAATVAPAALDRGTSAAFVERR